jgi:hypothetical protein
MMASILFRATGFGWVVQRAHVQRDAVSSVRSVGGEGWYKWQRSAPPKDGRPGWRKWLGDRLGRDFFEDVTVVTFGPRSMDTEMEAVGRLDRLKISPWETSCRTLAWST